MLSAHRPHNPHNEYNSHPGQLDNIPKNTSANNSSNSNNNNSNMRVITGGPSSSGGDFVSTSLWTGQAVRRIRTPHPHDVLCGRGGGINSHPGNCVFRDWVRERKNDYNLAASKADKAIVAAQVMRRVSSLQPAGRFLQRDTAGGGFWIEIDETKAMAKTSQALREGAPSIRAQYQRDMASGGGKTQLSKRGTKRPRDNAVTTTAPVPTIPSPTLPAVVANTSPFQKASTPPTTAIVFSPLMSNQNFHHEHQKQTNNPNPNENQDNIIVINDTTEINETHNNNNKRQRVDNINTIPGSKAHVILDDSTPTLLPAAATEAPPALSLVAKTTEQQPPIDPFIRIEGDLRLDPFVNPFENEEEVFQELLKQEQNNGYQRLASYRYSINVCPRCGTHGQGCACSSIQPEDWALVSSV